MLLKRFQGLCSAPHPTPPAHASSVSWVPLSWVFSNPISLNAVNVTHWKYSWAHWVQSASILGSPSHLCWFNFIFWVCTTLTCFSRNQTAQSYTQRNVTPSSSNPPTLSLACLLHLTHACAHSYAQISKDKQMDFLISPWTKQKGAC